jgi:glycogen synthase kinase 3 beta
VDVWSAGCIVAELLTREPIFPGDSALEQLIEIMKIIGSPSKEYLQKYSPEACDLISMPRIPNVGWQRVLKKFNPEPELVDLLANIIVYDGATRFTPLQVLKHKYFHDLPNPKYQTLLHGLPSLLEFGTLRNNSNHKDILEL